MAMIARTALLLALLVPGCKASKPEPEPSDEHEDPVLGCPELATHLEMVRCGDPDDVDTWRRGHVVSSPMSDANAPR